MISLIKFDDKYTYYINYKPTYREFVSIGLCTDAILTLLGGTQQSLLKDIEIIKKSKDENND